MSDGAYSLEKSWQRVKAPPEVQFEDVWPSETRGDGRLLKNNINTGSAQGKSSMIRKAHCRLCGFPNDMNAVDHSGGSIDGNGAGSTITASVATITLASGTVHTENYGSQAYSKNSGCALCLSKNSISSRTIVSGVDPWNGNPRATGF